MYSIGGKDASASSVIERYEIDGKLEELSELNCPRYYASACAFENKYIYIYGGYSFATSQLINKIERIDHLHPNVSPSLIELEANEIPSLTGSLLKQYDESTLLILGGKSQKFSHNVYYFDWKDIVIKSEDVKEKNENSFTNLFHYQTDSLLTNNPKDEDRRVYFIDWLNHDYTLQSLIV